MGATFPFYILVDNDIHKGFVYEQIPHIRLETIARNPDIKPGMSRRDIEAAIKRHAEIELLYDHPHEDSKKLRVSGPFTVESLSPHSTVVPIRSESEKTGTEDDGSAFEKSIVDNLLKAGVQNGRKAERLLFESLTPLRRGVHPGGGRAAGARSSGSRWRSGRSSGRWTRSGSGSAAREATRGLGFDLLLVCAFAFDPQA